MDSIKDVVRSSVKVPEFDKHLKKAGGHIGRNVVEIAIKMKTIVRKPLMIKINKLDRAEHWRIRRLKESAHMLGYNDLLSRPSMELNTIWEPIIKKARQKNKNKK